MSGKGSSRACAGFYLTEGHVLCYTARQWQIVRAEGEVTAAMTADLGSTVLYKKALGCLLGGLIGDAMGTPTEGKDYRDIERQFGWVDDFDCSGTDDTVMKHLLSEALISENSSLIKDLSKNDILDLCS